MPDQNNNQINRDTLVPLVAVIAVVLAAVSLTSIAASFKSDVEHRLLAVEKQTAINAIAIQELNRK